MVQGGDGGVRRPAAPRFIGPYRRGRARFPAGSRSPEIGR
jgi:hypothetical protein